MNKKNFLIVLLVFLIVSCNKPKDSSDDNNSTINTYLQIMMIYMVGWLLGVIVIGAPAGIGVRESVYLLLLQPLAPSMGLLIAFLLLSRIVNIVAEVLLYLLSFLLTDM